MQGLVKRSAPEGHACLSLYPQPKLLFLDKPFANLDPIYQRNGEWLLDHVANGGTIFLCSHVLEMAERMCNRMAIINHGRVLALEQSPV